MMGKQKVWIFIAIDDIVVVLVPCHLNIVDAAFIRVAEYTSYEDSVLLLLICCTLVNSFDVAMQFPCTENQCIQS
jgi:hypothetical protein